VASVTTRLHKSSVSESIFEKRWWSDPPIVLRPARFNTKNAAVCHTVYLCFLWFLRAQSTSRYRTVSTVLYCTVPYCTVRPADTTSPYLNGARTSTKQEHSLQVNWAQIILSVGYILTHFKPYNYNSIFYIYTLLVIFVTYPWYNTDLKMATKCGRNM